MELNTIRWKVEGGIGHLTLDQPPSNTMDRRFFDELSVLTRMVIRGSGIRALVVYGTGRHFSSGADPGDLCRRVRESLPSNYPQEIPAFLSMARDCFQYIEKLPVPTFAAIRGVCLGSALELALACRFRICAEGAVFGFPESSFGLMPGCGGTVMLTKTAGRQKAIELLLGGRNFSAGEALEMGLVHRIVSRKTVVEETLKIAKGMISTLSL
ncbi:MAG: enoyl-CoA hydratase/isomerase family protein [Bacteroidales bacterium]|nr:enoyl-CoA hydratase/isomerase family protein [Bacteroidales bacterium]